MRILTQHEIAMMHHLLKDGHELYVRLDSLTHQPTMVDTNAWKTSREYALDASMLSTNKEQKKIKASKRVYFAPPKAFTPSVSGLKTFLPIRMVNLTQLRSEVGQDRFTELDAELLAAEQKALINAERFRAEQEFGHYAKAGKYA